MTDRICETFSAPAAHRLDAVLEPSDLLGHRALTVYAACAAAMTLRGDLAECGVAGGETAVGILRVAGALSDKRLYLFDTFGKVPIAGRNNLAAQAVATHARTVAQVVQRLGLDDDVDDVVFRAGLFSQTLADFSEELCFVHADGDLYESTCDIIAMADRAVVRGGVVVFDDYGTEWTGVTRAVDERLATERWWTYAVKGYGQLVAVRK